MAEVISLLIPALQAYTSQGLTATETTDALAASVRVGNFEASRLAPALSDILGVASVLSVEFHELAAAQAAASLVQPNLQRNAVGLLRVLESLSAPSVQARQELNAIGETSSSLRDRLANNGLLETLLFLNDAVDGNVETLQRLFESSEAYRFLQNLLAQDLTATRDRFDAVANAGGSLNAVYAEFADTAALEASRVASEFSDTLAELGRVMFPIVQTMADFFIPILQRLGALLESDNAFVRTLTQLLVVLGPVLIGIAITLGVIAGIIALITGPVAIIVAGVVAVGAALLIVLGYWESIYGVIQNIARTVGLGFLFGGGESDQPSDVVSSAPVLHEGGIVPGRTGETVFARLQAGELVVPAPIVTQVLSGQSSGESVMNVSIGDVRIDSDSTDPAAVAREVRRELERISFEIIESNTTREVI